MMKRVTAAPIHQPDVRVGQPLPVVVIEAPGLSSMSAIRATGMNAEAPFLPCGSRGTDTWGAGSPTRDADP